MFGGYLFIEARLGKPCNSKVVGYCMGNKNDFGSKGLSHLHSEILGPFVLDHWFRTEFKRDSEKGPFDIFFWHARALVYPTSLVLVSMWF